MAQGIFNLKQVNQAIRQGAWSGFIAPKFVEYLVVAGGGAGGYVAGGGGAGGLLTGIVPVTAGTSYTVTVGAGGAGGTAGGAGASGSNSVFGAISSTGGGAGGSYASVVGVSGGSGGGANNGGTGLHGTIGQGVFNQGNAGGLSWAFSNYTGGGGGGAGTVGLNSKASGSADSAGNGGAGIASSISGTVTTYAGGGGGGADTQGTGGSGGVGGGGAGGISRGATGGSGSVNSFAGSPNTGGGSGGYGVGGSSGAGGSGIVIVRYPGSIQFYTGGAVTYANGHVVHKFYVTDTLAPTTPTAISTTGDYQISRSLRFNSADNASLTRTPATATNRRTWTWSAWFKRGALATYQIMLCAGQASNANEGIFYFISNNVLNYYEADGSGNAIINLGGGAGAELQDPSAWYHIVLSVDTTQATATDRAKIYVNGVDVTYTGGTYPTQNYQTAFNMTYAHYIGTRVAAIQYLDGYLTEINFIDGQALTPSSFGETSAITGVWQPKSYTGTYGTNGFEINFSDNSNTTAATLGKDYSGNGNNFTPQNFSVTAGIGNDSFVDTPTPYGTDTGVGGEVRGNYCTWNNVEQNSTAALSNGNLTNSSAGTNRAIRGTIGVSSGKWYWEWTEAASPDNHIGVWGVSSLTAGAFGYVGEGTDNWGIHTLNGNKRNNGGNVAYGSAYASGNVGMCAMDLDHGKIWWGKNGTWFASGDPASGQNAAFTNLSGTLRPAQLQYSAANFNFGQRAFAYTAPIGFKALCTTNLPAPTIGSSPTSLATKYFNSVVWTGNSANPRTITGVGFQPDWVWVKRRDAGGNNFLQDAVRGVTSTDSRTLATNNTDAETNYYTLNGALTAFTSDGFTLSGGSTNLNLNGSPNTYVAWNWKASNATAVTNTSGSLTSQVSANPTAGFSVLTYTGNAAAAQTIGHGLGVPPAMIIVKGRTGGNWSVWHKSFSIDQYLFLNSQAVPNTVTGYWGTSNPTSTVFGVIGGGYGNNSGTAVAYCFAEIEGYSSFGSFTGNGSANGPFVYTGFKPAFLLTKDISNAATNWYLWDSVRSTYNSNYNLAYPGSNDAENTTALPVDFLSNGFKPRVAGNGFNTGGATVIYMAFASNPFKYSLAR